MYLDWHDMSIDTWLKKQQYKNFKPDEICLYALNAVIRRHTIVFTEYQPWCTVDRKPAMLSTFMEEACEMKLLYLGENLNGELHKKPFLAPPPPFNLDHIQLTHRLERDHNIPEMYLVDTQASDLNQYNQNIVRDVQNYVSPTDITCVMCMVP